MGDGSMAAAMSLESSFRGGSAYFGFTDFIASCDVSVWT